MTSSEKALSERIDRLEESIKTLQISSQNEINSLFFSLLGWRLRKKILEEVVEMSVLEYFGADRADFLGRSFVKRGPSVDPESNDKRVIESRKWFLSIMTYILRKTPYTLSINYPFYHQREVKKHSVVFMSALDPKCDKDQKNREILLAITDIVKRICVQEGILSEEFDFL